MRRRVNHIKSLKLDDGLGCYDKEKIKLKVVNFFRQLYIVERIVSGKFSMRYSFPSIDYDWKSFLSKDLSS